MARTESRVLAFHMSIHDDGTYMLGPDTYRVPHEAGYYDWRFGRNGVPHPATCPTCGRKTDPDYINSEFRVRRRVRDIASTYDGYVLVSRRFREFCIAKNWHGDVRFITLPADDNYFVFRPTQTLEFDAQRRKTRFEEHCPECNHFFSVVGAAPAFLRSVDSPIMEGFFRTDLEFASGHQQHPLIIVGTETAKAIEHEAFQKVHFTAVE